MTSDTPEPHVPRTVVDSVTAVLAVQKLATGNQSSTKLKHLSRSRKNNFLRVLLDTGSDGDLIFHKKGSIKWFPYLNRQVPKSWHTSNGCFHTKGGGKVTLQFIKYSNSKEYTVNPDVVEYSRRKMTKPAFDLILGVKTLREFGIVLDFWTKEITIDEISLPMRDINKLSNSSKIEKAWSVTIIWFMNQKALRKPLNVQYTS